MYIIKFDMLEVSIRFRQNGWIEMKRLILWWQLFVELYCISTDVDELW